ncbi:MAG: hypothetical protein HFE39_09055 [Clostridiales bacterium]|jgi:phage gp45-like|nr:hypothetical protein [Clostridiales bacterium]
MWLSQQLNAAPGGTVFARRGDVTGCQSSAITVRSGEERRGIPLAGPYGVTALPVQGAAAVLLELEGQAVCAGVEQAVPPGLEPGEIALCSSGGARIILKNDGTIHLNATVIPAAEQEGI